MPPREHWRKVKRAGQGQPVIKSQPLNSLHCMYFPLSLARYHWCNRHICDCCDAHRAEQVARRARRRKPREVMSESVVVHIVTHSFFATQIFLIFPHIGVSQSEETFFFSPPLVFGTTNMLSSVFLKLFQSERGFLLHRHTAFSTWGPGSLGEVSRHLCSGNNCTA